MGVYPMWMNKRGKKIAVEIPVGGGSGGGSGGGGFTIARVEKEIPKVTIRKVVDLDEYENINITVLKIVDLSLSGG